MAESWTAKTRKMKTRDAIAMLAESSHSRGVCDIDEELFKMTYP
jgi:hypothetical protein